MRRLLQLDVVLSLVNVLGTQKPAYGIGKGEHAYRPYRWIVI